MEVSMTNKPLTSKINWFNIITMLAAIFAMPQMQEMGMKPEHIIFIQGVLTVILRTFFNKGGK